MPSAATKTSRAQLVLDVPILLGGAAFRARDLTVPRSAIQLARTGASGLDKARRCARTPTTRSGAAVSGEHASLPTTELST